MGSFLLIILTNLALMVVLIPIGSLIPMPEIFKESYLSMINTDAVSFLTVVIAAKLFSGQGHFTLFLDLCPDKPESGTNDRSLSDWNFLGRGLPENTNTTSSDWPAFPEKS